MDIKQLKKLLRSLFPELAHNPVWEKDLDIIEKNSDSLAVFEALERLHLFVADQIPDGSPQERQREEIIGMLTVLRGRLIETF